MLRHRVNDNTGELATNEAFKFYLDLFLIEVYGNDWRLIEINGG